MHAPIKDPEGIQCIRNRQSFFHVGHMLACLTLQHYFPCLWRLPVLQTLLAWLLLGRRHQRCHLALQLRRHNLLCCCQALVAKLRRRLCLWLV